MLVAVENQLPNAPYRQLVHSRLIGYSRASQFLRIFYIDLSSKVAPYIVAFSLKLFQLYLPALGRWLYLMDNQNGQNLNFKAQEPQG